MSEERIEELEKRIETLKLELDDIKSRCILKEIPEPEEVEEVEQAEPTESETETAPSDTEQ